MCDEVGWNEASSLCFVMMECTNPRLCMVLDTLLSMVGAGLALGNKAAVGNVSHSWLTRDLPMFCKELVCPALQIKHTICLWQKKNARRRLTKPFVFFSCTVPVPVKRIL